MKLCYHSTCRYIEWFKCTRSCAQIKWFNFIQYDAYIGIHKMNSSEKYYIQLYRKHFKIQLSECESECAVTEIANNNTLFF